MEGPDVPNVAEGPMCALSQHAVKDEEEQGLDIASH